MGLLAVSATLAVARRSPGWERATWALVAWGMIDFAAAFSLALLANEGVPLHLEGANEPALVLSLPLALIPAFGVPVFTILHTIAWLKLRETA